MIPGLGDNKQALMRTFISRFARDEFLIDIVKAGLYPASFVNIGDVEQNSTVGYIHKFLTDLSKMVKTVQLTNYTAIQTLIIAVQTVLTIRESGTHVISYDNVFQHIGTEDLSVQKLIRSAVDNKLTTTDDFRKVTDNIINVIQAFNEIDAVSLTITSFGAFQNEVQSDNLSPFQSLKRYKELIIRAYNDLSQLQSLTKQESESDYFVISDENSCEALARDLVDYISDGYSFLKTGVELLDTYVDGLESNSLHVVAAPSNHGKSIWMANICKGVIASNIMDYDEKDAVIFITLEDHKNKLVRRFCSIFGNFAHELLKDLFMKSYNILSSLQYDKGTVKNNLVQIFNYVLRDSIAKVTSGKVNLVIKHCQENTFSPGDVSRFIDRLKVEGLNTRAVFIDYIDVMSPTTQRYTSYKDYDTHGQITQELRNLALVHKLPVFTATQCNRAGEDFGIPLNNNMIADSIKKLRYTDFLYMARMRRDMSLMSDDVKRHVIKDDSELGNSEFIRNKDYILNLLIPFEVKITKSKEGRRDIVKYLLFCQDNLKIYNSLSEFMQEFKETQANRIKLSNDINALTYYTISTLSEDADNIQIEFDANSSMTLDI